MSSPCKATLLLLDALFIRVGISLLPGYKALAVLGTHRERCGSCGSLGRVTTTGWAGLVRYHSLRLAGHRLLQARVFRCHTG